MSVFSKASRLLGAVLLIAAPAAFAEVQCAATQDPNICVTIEPLPPAVSKSLSDTLSYATYLITIANNGSSDLNRVRFSGYTLVAPDGSGSAVFVDPSTGDPPAPEANPIILAGGSVNVSCSTGLTSISCAAVDGSGAYLTIPPHGGKASFTVAVLAPQAGTSISFFGEAFFAEGNSGSDGAENGVGDAFPEATTSLTEPATDKVSTFVPVADFVATGYSAIATASDPYTTEIFVVPEGGNVVTAAIDESCSATATFCSKLSVLLNGNNQKATYLPQGGGGLGELLQIELRLDASVTRGNIKNVVVYYQPDRESSALGDKVKSCSELGGVDGLQPLPQAGYPCVASRIVYTRSYVKAMGLDTQFTNDWGILISAVDNGRIVIAP